MDVDAVPLPAFALSEEWSPFRSERHSHRRHQLLFCARGSMRLDADGGTWPLPPQRAAWIGAGVPHRVEAARPVALRTVYFDPDPDWLPDARCAVSAVSEHAGAMILHAMRWGPDPAQHDALARSYLETLGRLCAEWVAEPLAWRLPRAESPEVARAMRYTLDRGHRRGGRRARRLLDAHPLAPLQGRDGHQLARLPADRAPARGHGAAGHPRHVDPRRGPGPRLRQPLGLHPSRPRLHRTDALGVAR